MPDSEPNFANPDDTWETPSNACCFGAPLTRMVKLEYLSSSSAQSTDLEDSKYSVRDEEINLIEGDMSLFNLALARRDGEDSDDDLSLRSPPHAFVHHVIDHMVSHTQGLSSPRVGIPYPELHHQLT
jgi:hypothetical protein